VKEFSSAPDCSSLCKDSRREKNSAKKSSENLNSPRKVAQKECCGKSVHGMCTLSFSFAHFSLAPCRSIGDNPALFLTAVRGPTILEGLRAGH
jgi:hypothetical protein